MAANLDKVDMLLIRYSSGRKRDRTAGLIDGVGYPRPFMSSKHRNAKIVAFRLYSSGLV